MSWIAIGASVAGGVAGAGASAAFSGGGGSNPSIQTKVIDDPYKAQLAKPLEGYLRGQIGQGIGNMPVDQAYQNRYSDFMGMNANDIFNRDVYNPQLALYKAQQEPLISESFAGNLRGSGHYGAREEGMANWNAEMGKNRFAANQAITGAQLSAGQNYQKQAYDQWYNSLPQNNPALKQGLDFLNNSTNTGQTVLSGLDPGQDGWMGSLLNTLISGGVSAYSSNQLSQALKPSSNNYSSGIGAGIPSPENSFSV